MAMVAFFMSLASDYPRPSYDLAESGRKLFMWSSFGVIIAIALFHKLFALGMTKAGRDLWFITAKLHYAHLFLGVICLVVFWIYE